MSVKRYHTQIASEHAEGAWVRHEDYAALEKEKTYLFGRVTEMTAEIRTRSESQRAATRIIAELEAETECLRQLLNQFLTSDHRFDMDSWLTQVRAATEDYYAAQESALKIGNENS